jgi:hypothetical protein
MSDYIGRLINDKIRVYAPDPWTLQVFLQERADQRNLPCNCCATDCGTLTVTVEWCGMTVTHVVPIPGSAGNFSIPDASLPDGSYMYVSVQISCTPCGWHVGVGMCAQCVSTNQFTGETWEALVPFSDTPEASGVYCPELGTVDLTCFGDQFGIPCVTTATGVIE